MDLLDLRCNPERQFPATIPPTIVDVVP